MISHNIQLLAKASGAGELSTSHASAIYPCDAGAGVPFVFQSFHES
jgi:hypothetical protein